MYFLYGFILCYTSTLIPSVNSYVVLAANLNDFKSLAKKYVPNKDLIDQINMMVLETGQKHTRGTYKENEPIDRTVEYVEEEEDDSDEVQGPVYRYQLKSPPRASLFEPQEPAPVKPLAGPTILTIDDVVDTLKHRLLQEIIDKSRDRDAQVNKQAKKMQVVGYKHVENKPKRQVKKPVPMKVLKEEVQFEGTYEDTRDKDVQPRIQYLGQVQIPPQYLKKKPVTDEIFTKKVVPKKQKFVSLKNIGASKKVRYVKQVLVPANSNKGWSQYILSPSLVQQMMHQPILGQQSKIVQTPFFVKQPMLEPQLSSMQQPNLTQQPKLLQQPLVQQPSIVQQLSLMQQQIDRLNKIALQNIAKNKQVVKPTLLTALKDIEAVEAPFEISLNLKEDVQQANDNKEDIVQVVEDTLSEETTIEPVTETNLSVPTTEENEQFIEDESVGTVENYEALEETTPEALTETSSNNEKEEKTVDEATTSAVDILVNADNAARLGETTKNHTQEFGKSDGQPIVEKTYNFDAPLATTKVPVKLNLPIESARKVMLF